MSTMSFGGFAVHVSLTLNSNPVMSKRMWFPMRTLRNGGPGKIWASEWIIGVKNKVLQGEGFTAKINIDPEPKSFY